MPTRQRAIVSTKNVKGLTFVDPELNADEQEKASQDEITVVLDVEVPESLTEAASEDFYGDEEKALAALQQDWQRRSVNAARPILRTSETQLDWHTVAQNAADSYKPGRRGGFQAKVSLEDLEKYDNVDDLRNFLASIGVAK